VQVKFFTDALFQNSDGLPRHFYQTMNQYHQNGHIYLFHPNHPSTLNSTLHNFSSLKRTVKQCTKITVGSQSQNQTTKSTFTSHLIEVCTHSPTSKEACTNIGIYLHVVIQVYICIYSHKQVRTTTEVIWTLRDYSFTHYVMCWKEHTQSIARNLWFDRVYVLVCILRQIVWHWCARNWCKLRWVV
jgi:hypothetical protein